MAHGNPAILHPVDDAPPRALTLFLALQHLAVLSSGFVYPLVVAGVLGLPPSGAVSLLALSMVASGVSTMLQSLRDPRLGSGWLVAMNPSSTYVPGIMAAAPLGGMALIQTMTIAAGLAEACLARIMPRLRPYFPPEISGLVLVMIAVSLAGISFDYLFGQTLRGDPLRGDSLVVGAAALAAMVALGVWGSRLLRLFCLILGMGFGWVLALALGLEDPAQVLSLAGLPFLAVPDVSLPGAVFDWSVFATFLAGALASAFKTSGNVLACQKFEDPDWKRADMASIGGGVMAEAAGTVLAGLTGGMGLTSSSGNVGLSIASGATSRVIGLVLGGLLVVLAFFPAFPALLAYMPRPVLGAALIFSCCYTLTAGIQVISSRLLDTRRTFVLGLAFMAGVAEAVDPEMFADVPALLRPLVDSSLAVSVFLALALNVLFRLGARSTRVLTLGPGQPWIPLAHGFLAQACAAFGARREVAARADLVLEEVLQLVEGSATPGVPGRLEMFFDEFSLDVSLFSDSPLPDLSSARPLCPAPGSDPDSGQDAPDPTPADMARLSGYLVRTLADRVEVKTEKGLCVVKVHFEH
jgi:NCS2 family nucleobase:cation symporter-2